MGDLVDLVEGPRSWLAEGLGQLLRGALRPASTAACTCARARCAAPEAVPRSSPSGRETRVNGQGCTSPVVSRASSIRSDAQRRLMS
ncbi:hypothetical protein BJ969_001101 [Saccharopolyspora gloriosae]|uniref:Uncharacterized protein n=1 Tax=Saccharopolyspora gloriosae TaxID=455344 RepID=A0A840NCE2_9PSEU|nr:hypothetical protein [Saccharopolyspora gloriosae]MBB5068013.1 hypothetical protein [Saccharopolyspora gloriosae]